MALLTGGTAATTTLRALLIAGNLALPGANIQNVAAINALIKAQNTTANVERGTPFSPDGLLKLPGGRGIIQCAVGDYIMVDPASGWPIVVTAPAITGGGFVHS